MEELLVTCGMNLHDALKRLDETARNVLLLVDQDRRLLRTVTDGDIRRLLLTGMTLDATLAELPAGKPKTAPAGITNREVLRLLNEFQIDQLPLVDEEGRPVRLCHRRDLDSPILLSTPHIGDIELDYIQEAFQSNWIAPLGPNVDAFERELAQLVGVGHAVALSSGTAALHLGLRVLGVGPGDTVFCSTFTFVASANPILYQGADPVFIDSDPETWNMSSSALERAFRDAERSGRVPKAVIVVNLYGQSADLDQILRVCNRYGVPVLEDAAESLGATYKGKASGTLGRLGVYSFNGNKIITTSGGGMLISDEPDLIHQARFLATQAKDPVPHYQHSQLGYNYRMSNVLAGIGRGQLRVLEDRVAARRAVFDRYRQGLASVSAIRFMPEVAYGRSTHWLTACLLDPRQTEVSPQKLGERLADENIEVRRVWKPMHLQPLFAGAPYFPHEKGKSIADELFACGVCLPSGSNLTIGQLDRAIEAIARIVRGK
jgi:dTDP-4-amino-4,6-dideoxygalactose transaminase